MTIMQMGVGDTAVTGACGALTRATQAPVHVRSGSALSSTCCSLVTFSLGTQHRQALLWSPSRSVCLPLSERGGHAQTGVLRSHWPVVPALRGHWCDVPALRGDWRSPPPQRRSGAGQQRGL